MKILTISFLFLSILSFSHAKKKPAPMIFIDPDQPLLVVIQDDVSRGGAIVRGGEMIENDDLDEFDQTTEMIEVAAEAFTQMELPVDVEIDDSVDRKYSSPYIDISVVAWGFNSAGQCEVRFSANVRQKGMKANSLKASGKGMFSLKEAHIISSTDDEKRAREDVLRKGLFQIVRTLDTHFE